MYRVVLDYVDDGVSVDEPHDARLRVAGDAATEARPFALLHGHWVRPADEHGRRSRLNLVRYLLRYPGRNIRLTLYTTT